MRGREGVALSPDLSRRIKRKEEASAHRLSVSQKSAESG